MDAGISIGGLNVEREEFTDSKFDLFSKTDYEVGVEKSISQTFRPLTTSSSQGPFSFLIPSDPEKFTNVESLRLHGRMRIRKKNPTTGELTSLTDEYISLLIMFSTVYGPLLTQNLTDVKYLIQALNGMLTGHTLKII